VTGGTSAASPLAAGMFALLAGEVGCSQGDVHAEIYALGTAQQKGGPKVFNDITSGSNDYVDPNSGITIQGFSAGAGYDLATGWGSVDLAALVSNWPKCNATSTTSGTSTGAGASSSSTGSSSGGSSTGSSTGGTTGRGGSTGSSTGGSSTGATRRSGTSTGARHSGEIEVASGGCSCGSGGAGSSGETLLLWGPLALVALGRRKRR
jgi:MYXO-CTERM domain-containing protein